MVCATVDRWWRDQWAAAKLSVSPCGRTDALFEFCYYWPGGGLAFCLTWVGPLIPLVDVSTYGVAYNGDYGCLRHGSVVGTWGGAPF